MAGYRKNYAWLRNTCPRSRDSKTHKNSPWIEHCFRSSRQILTYSASSSCNCFFRSRTIFPERILAWKQFSIYRQTKVLFYLQIEFAVLVSLLSSSAIVWVPHLKALISGHLSSSLRRMLSGFRSICGGKKDRENNSFSFSSDHQAERCDCNRRPLPILFFLFFPPPPGELL